MSERPIDDRTLGYVLIELLISIVLTGVLISSVSGRELSRRLECGQIDPVRFGDRWVG